MDSAYRVATAFVLFGLLLLCVAGYRSSSLLQEQLNASRQDITILRAEHAKQLKELEADFESRREIADLEVGRSLAEAARCEEALRVERMTPEPCVESAGTICFRNEDRHKLANVLVGFQECMSMMRITGDRLHKLVEDSRRTP